MVSEGLDYSILLLDNYKKLNLNENEVTTLFMIKRFIDQGNPFVTADLLSLKMSLNVKEIDKILAGLLTRGFIEYKTQGKKTITTLDPLEKKLYREFQLNISRNNQIDNEQVNETLENIYGEFEKLLNRPLSPVEFGKIREWVCYGFSDEMIINALKDALSKGKKSLRSVDKILLSYQTREDIEENGISPINEEWNKNLEETIKIAKTPWIDQDLDDDK